MGCFVHFLSVGGRVLECLIPCLASRQQHLLCLPLSFPLLGHEPTGSNGIHLIHVGLGFLLALAWALLSLNTG